MEEVGDSMRSNVADLILTGEIVNYEKWLSKVVAELASRFDNLDNMSPRAMLPLVAIAINAGADAKRLKSACDMELDEIQRHIDALYEFRFINEDNNTFSLTSNGEKLFNAFGRNMVEYEKFELGRRKDVVDLVSEKINRVSEF